MTSGSKCHLPPGTTLSLTASSSSRIGAQVGQTPEAQECVQPGAGHGSLRRRHETQEVGEVRGVVRSARLSFGVASEDGESADVAVGGCAGEGRRMREDCGRASEWIAGCSVSGDEYDGWITERIRCAAAPTTGEGRTGGRGESDEVPPAANFQPTERSVRRPASPPPLMTAGCSHSY